MENEELKFIDDKLFVRTQLPPYNQGICITRLVMTKEAFQECYKKWIETPEQNAEAKAIDLEEKETRK